MEAALEIAATPRDAADDRIVAHDARWQHPAVTEQHAYAQMRRAAGLIPAGSAYLGFPWATLIDLIDNKPAEAAPLMRSLAALSEQLAGKSRVVTVCQHIRLLNHQHLFTGSGVTDIFWSHATKGMETLPERPSVRLHPFPLYPVQVPELREADGARDILFSFVGARARDFYLSEARNHILDLLAGDPRGYVRGRSDWHYNRIVYEHQILAAVDGAAGLVDDAASLEFQDVLARSVFSLCPSGSGPNSIRLWESLGAGAIPVILADTWAPPGDPALWRQAAVFCAETPEAIAALPERLAALAEDAEQIASMRQGMRQLWRLYGPDSFVYDIEKLFVATAAAGALGPRAPLPLGRERLLALAEGAQADDPDAAAHDDVLLIACAGRMLLDTPGFARLWRETPALEAACARLVAASPQSPSARSFLAARRRFETAAQHTEEAASAGPVRICRRGANALRMPLSYEAYGALLQGLVEETARPEEADVLLFAASPNILSCAAEIFALRRANPALRVAVLSEEPLWDTTWARDWGQRRGRLEASTTAVEYAILSHATTDIFAFETIPYFVTTTDDFFVRYARMFRRNAAMTPEAVLDHWRRAPIRAAFFAERRHGAQYDFREPAEDLEGLCAYRTRLAEAMEGEGVLRVGKGWAPRAARRQDLPDWHLDKLATLDRRAYVVSGIENTHFRDYITEKPLDAFAALALPLYYASPRHRIHEIVPETAYLNLYGLPAEEAAAAIAAFEPDRAFAVGYLDAQRRLADLFGDPRRLMRERARVAQALARALARLCVDEKAGRA